MSITKLAAVLNGLVKNTDLTTQEIVVDSVKVGGSSGTALTKTVLDGLVSNSHASGSDNQTITAGSGLTGGGSGSTVTIDFNPDGSSLEVYSDAVRVKALGITDAMLAGSISDSKLSEDYLKVSEIGSPNKAASLDGAGKVPVTQLPNSVMEFKGAWNASTNAPTIGDDAVAGEYASKVEQDITWTAQNIGSAGNDIDIIYTPYTGGGSNYVTVNGTEITLHVKLDDRLAMTLISLVSDYPAAAALAEGSLTGTNQDQDTDASFSLAGGVDTILAANAGDVYRVSVEGTRDLGSGNITFYVGDFAIYSGTVWQRSPMASGVISVNGQTGAAVLDADDISDTSTTNKWSSTSEKTKVGYISVTQAVDLDTMESASHSHSNKATLDSITAAYTTAEATKVGHISVTQAVDLDTIESASHSHSNKSTLDTYTQSETDLADAVSKKHSHSNMTDLNAVSGTNTGDQTAATVTYSPDDQNNWQSPPTYVEGGLDELAARVVASEDIIGSGIITKNLVCGETFAANTSFLVRLALNGETAERIFKATNAAASTDGKFWAVGMIQNATEKVAGNSVSVTLFGKFNLNGSEVFASTDIGKPVWLTTAGGFSITAPSASDTACLKIGVVLSTSSILVGNIQLTVIN